MSKLMLDTSAYAAFKRGTLEAVTSLRKTRSILLTPIVLGELLAGFEVGSQRKQNRTELQEFMRSPRVQTVPITMETSERYASILLISAVLAARYQRMTCGLQPPPWSTAPRC